MFLSEGHFFMMAAEIVIIILELNWAGEKKEAGFLFFGVFFTHSIYCPRLLFRLIHGEHFFHFAF